MVFNWFKRLFCVFLGFGVTTHPSPTDIVLPREGHCSSSNNQQGRGALCVTCEPDSYRNAVRVIFSYLKSG